MGRTIDDIIAELPADRQAAIHAEADGLIAGYQTLQDMRKSRKFTQEELANTLGKKQAAIAQLEKRSDLLLSTLRGYVEGMGGKLNLVVEFPDRDPSMLHGLASNEDNSHHTK